MIADTGRARRLLELTAIAADLADEELEMLIKVAEGAAMGQARYGLLRAAEDGRDWGEECVAELRDAVFYLGAELIRQRSRGR